VQRRHFLSRSVVAATSALAAKQLLLPGYYRDSTDQLGPIHSYDPVIGDGYWIWRDPPEKERGYLEPRSYEVSIGVQLQGLEDRTEAMAATPVPVSHPEQKVEEVRIETVGCDAVIRELAPGAAQLMMHARSFDAGQIVKAIAHYKVTIFKQYHAFQIEQFPEKQVVPKEIRMSALGDSPGIQANAGRVRKLARELSQGISHPWNQAKAFVEWIRNNIRPQYGPYTSVLTAIDKRVGDCEEMSALFVAFCRASGIPARLVWVPNHNWTEFYLVDNEDTGHWIPVHPACYHWFGWTGVHELVLQKGDRVHIPEQSSPSRLIMDWMRSNARPRANYTAELTPLPSTEGGDPGPGGRRKDAKTGEWKITGKHEMDRYARR
jgi:transglutaminase-like putative cysteine protease